MPGLIVRNLDQKLINALKARAAEHRRSTEAEHKAILTAALLKPPRKSFAEALASIPTVGKDTDFQHSNPDSSPNNVLD